MDNQTKGNTGLESLVNSIQPVNVDEVIGSTSIITGSTPSYMTGTKAKYYIQVKAGVKPAKGQEVIVIPTEIRDGEIKAVLYPLTAIDQRLKQIEKEFTDLTKKLPEEDKPYDAVVTLFNELVDITEYLDKYEVGSSFLLTELRKKIEPLKQEAKCLFSEAESLSSLVETSVDLLGGDDINIFNKPLTAYIDKEYEEGKEGDVTPVIGEHLVFLDPTHTEYEYFRRNLIHYLHGNVQVRLVSVDEDKIIHCNLAEVPQEAAIKYSNYLKINAEKTNDLEQAKELFTKIDDLRQYLEDGYEESQDQFLPKINENYIIIRGKYAILSARENGILRICSKDEYEALEALLDPGTIQTHSEKETLVGILTTRFIGQEVIVFAFDFLIQNRYPKGDVLIAPFFGPDTNKRTAEKVLARKLTEKDKFGIPYVFQLFPAALHQYDQTYLLTINKFSGNPIPGMSFVKSDARFGGYYLNLLHKPEFKLPL